VSPVLVEWDRTELAARVDDLLEVYAEAMEVSRASARGRRTVVAGHLERDGFRAVAALQVDRLVGIAYGYRGAPGQWWHDHVRAAMAPDLASTWLADPFEVCELHVRPELHGTGLGRDLLLRLVGGAEAATAVLTTPDNETRARAFYRSGGWVDLVRGLRFPGDPRSFAVLGLRL
jgi:GNAT superfamily N-acetyltransferase